MSTAARAKGARLLRLLPSRRGTLAAAYAFDDGGIIYGDQNDVWMVTQSLEAEGFVMEHAKAPIVDEMDFNPTF